VVESFICSQTQQLDVVAQELASQKSRIVLKEQSFAELSESIAGFVEAETQRLQGLGFEVLGDDTQREAIARPVSKWQVADSWD
ncbi:unnamed protein product, partial [Effrenium voratum]